MPETTQLLVFSAKTANNGIFRDPGKEKEKKIIPNTKQSFRLEALKIPRASEMVAEKLRSLIISGELAPGTGLPTEKELVIQLGVSRSTLREALRLLEAEDLISTKTGPKGGIFIRRPSSANLTRSLSLLLQLEEAPFSALLEARRLLEPLCAELSASRITSEELAELKASLEAMRESVGNTQKYLEEQLRFHLCIFAAAHNPVLRLYTTSVGELITTQTAEKGLSLGAQKIGVEAAERILAAITARNGRLAARRVEAHLRAFEAVLMNPAGVI